MKSGDPVSQIHSLTSTLVPLGLGTFSELLRSIQMLKRERERERERGLRRATEGTTAPIQSMVKVQPWFLSLRWKTCLRQNYSLSSCDCSEGPGLRQNTLIMMTYIYMLYMLHSKPNGAHGVSPLLRPCWIPPIPSAFMRAHGLAVCTPQYCTGH